MLLHQPGEQALGRFGVGSVLNEFVEHIAILIDGALEPVLLASNADDHPIQVPDVTTARLLATEAPGIVGTELPALSRDRLIRNNDPPLEQHLLNQPQAQGNRKYSHTA